MPGGALPPGWDLGRIRRETGVEDARLLDPELTRATVETREGPPQPLQVLVAISLGDVVLIQDEDDGCWYMGSGVRGVVHCWGQYGPDLAEALAAR